MPGRGVKGSVFELDAYQISLRSHRFHELNATNKLISARRLPPKTRSEGGVRKLVSQAGLVQVIKFLDALGFSGLFRRRAPRRNIQYQLVDAVFLVLVCLMGGVRGICQCVVLYSEEGLQRIAGWRLRIPNESTVARLFNDVGGYPGADCAM